MFTQKTIAIIVIALAAGSAMGVIAGRSAAADDIRAEGYAAGKNDGLAEGAKQCADAAQAQKKGQGPKINWGFSDIF